jgi:hypothetical protein
MLTDMGGNWGFEGQCHGNSIKACQYSLSRFDGFCGSFGESISNLDVFHNVDWRLI